eukprot:SAG11_NODE_20274_length_449_cov_0.737143_1_plen_54_part_01
MAHQKKRGGIKAGHQLHQSSAHIVGAISQQIDGALRRDSLEGQTCKELCVPTQW